MPDDTDDELPENIAKRLKEATDKIADNEEKIKNVPNEEPPALRNDPPGTGSADRNWRERKIAEYLAVIKQEKADVREDTAEMITDLSPEKKAIINRAVERALDPKDPEGRKNIDEVSRSQEFIGTKYAAQSRQEIEPIATEAIRGQDKDDKTQETTLPVSRSDIFVQNLKYTQNKKDITEPDDPAPVRPNPGRDRG